MTLLYVESNAGEVDAVFYEFDSVCDRIGEKKSVAIAACRKNRIRVKNTTDFYGTI